jgi:uncharacterized protein YcnI
MKTLKHMKLLATFPLFLIVASAHAHVTISPRESFTGVTETYTIRVPTERDSPTVQIEVEFPDEVTVQNIESPTDWKVEYMKDAAGRIDKAIWSGGSIPPDESAAFSFQADNPDNTGTLIWKAIQIHADGSRAEWIAEPGSRNPAPAVDILNK